MKIWKIRYPDGRWSMGTIYPYPSDGAGKTWNSITPVRSHITSTEGEYPAGTMIVEMALTPCGETLVDAYLEDKGRLAAVKEERRQVKQQEAEEKADREALALLRKKYGHDS